MIGLTGALGVAVAYGLVEVASRARSVLIIVGLALFIAVGLDPVVGWLVRRGFPRWAAVLTVIGCGVAVAAAFLAAAIPPLTSEATALAHQIPHYMQTLQDRNSQLGKLNVKYHIQQRLSKVVTSGGSSLIGGVLGAGELVLSTASFILVVVVLSIYFLAGLPRIKVFAYQLVPHSRRPRVILISNEVFAKVGGYLLGNFITSAIAGLGTFVWMLALGIPYPILLAMFVALADLLPVVGSTVGGAVVTLVALTVSLPVALATLGFYIAYRLAEDYLLVPRVMGRTVQVPAIVSLIAVLIGGVLLGIVGALVAIPVAAAIRLLLQEIAIRARQELGRTSPRYLFQRVPQPQLSRERLQIGLLGQPRQVAAGRVVGQQRDRHAERYLAPPVRLDPGDQVRAPWLLQRLADPAVGVQQRVGVPPARSWRGQCRQEQRQVLRRDRGQGSVTRRRDHPSRRPVPPGIMGQQLQLVPRVKGDKIPRAPRPVEQRPQPGGSEDTLYERLPQPGVVQPPLLLDRQQREPRQHPAGVQPAPGMVRGRTIGPVPRDTPHPAARRLRLEHVPVQA